MIMCLFCHAASLLVSNSHKLLWKCYHMGTKIIVVSTELGIIFCVGPFFVCSVQRTEYQDFPMDSATVGNHVNL